MTAPAFTRSRARSTGRREAVVRSTAPSPADSASAYRRGVIAAASAVIARDRAALEARFPRDPDRVAGVLYSRCTVATVGLSLPYRPGEPAGVTAEPVRIRALADTFAVEGVPSLPHWHPSAPPSLGVSP